MPNDQMRWRLPEHWTVIKSDGRQIRIEVSQDGNTLVGTAYDGADIQSPQMIGTMSGSVEGNTISFVIYWPDKAIAEFNGIVSREGRASATAVGRPDEALPEDWYAEPVLSAWE